MLARGNLLRYMCAKNYQNIHWYDKVIAKTKWCSFFYSRGYSNNVKDDNNNSAYLLRFNGGMRSPSCLH